jgi:hypothetical protein
VAETDGVVTFAGVVDVVTAVVVEVVTAVVVAVVTPVVVAGAVGVVRDVVTSAITAPEKTPATTKPDAKRPIASRRFTAQAV